MKTKITAIFMAMMIFVSSSTTAFAGLDSDLEGFLDDIGVMSNMSAPGSFQAGGRSVLSGGSISMRMKNNIPPLVTYQLPSARISCSGLDFNAGLISILNLDMIQKILQQGGTSLAWGLLVGLAYSLPTVSGVLEKIQKYTRWLQMLQGDMCQLGTEIGKSLGGKIGAAYNNKKAEEEVASGSAGTTVEAQSSIFDNPTDFAKANRGNIVYDALNGATGFSEDVKEFLMAVFGTVVWYPESDAGGTCTPSSPEKVKIQYKAYPAALQMEPDAIVNALVNGDNHVAIYECGAKCAAGGIIGTSCTSLTRFETTVDGVADAASTAITGAINNLASGANLTASQLEYLNVPVLPGFSELIMYLASQAKAGISVDNEISIVSTYYGYWFVESLLNYMNRAIHDNKANLLDAKDVPSDTAMQVDDFFDNFYQASGGISKVLAEKRKEFAELMQYQGNIMAFINTYGGKSANFNTSSITNALGSASNK